MDVLKDIVYLQKSQKWINKETDLLSLITKIHFLTEKSKSFTKPLNMGLKDKELFGLHLSRQ